MRMLVLFGVLALLTAAHYAYNAALNAAHAMTSHPIETFSDAVTSVLQTIFEKIRSLLGMN